LCPPPPFPSPVPLSLPVPASRSRFPFPIPIPDSLFSIPDAPSDVHRLNPCSLKLITNTLKPCCIRASMSFAVAG
jgi:hypothetical protein